MRIATLAWGLGLAWLGCATSPAAKAVATASLEGLVVDVDGRPLEADALLTNPADGSRRGAFASRDGKLRIESLPPGNFVLDLQAFDANVSGRFLVGVPNSPHTYVLRARPWVDVRVLDAGGKPVANAHVELRWAQPEVRGATDSKGTVSIQAAPGEYELVTFRPDEPYYAAAVLPIRLRPGLRLPVSVTLPRGSTLTGQILDPQGQPAPAVGVFVYRDPLGDHWLGARKATTDRGGRFEVTGLPDGQLTIVAFSEERRTMTPPVPTVAGAGGLVFRLRERPTVRGRITDESGKPVVSFTVISAATQVTTVRDLSGNFRVRLVDDDPEVLSIEAPGFARASITARVPLGTESDLGTIRLRRPTVVRSQVLDATTGTPLERVRIYEYFDFPKRRTALCGTGAVEPPEGSTWAETDKEGLFTIRQLGSDATLDISRDGYEPVRVRLTDVRDTIALRPAGLPSSRVEGRVLSQNGTPAFACVAAQAPHSPRLKAYTRGDGQFVLPLPYGTRWHVGSCFDVEGPEVEAIDVTVDDKPVFVTLRAIVPAHTPDER